MREIVFMGVGFVLGMLIKAGAPKPKHKAIVPKKRVRESFDEEI